MEKRVQAPQGRTWAASRSRGRVAGALAVAAAASSLGIAAPAQAATTPLFIAHRGDAGSAPEATNAAFRSAIAKGAAAIEMDVRYTKTKVPVILHDLTLDRTTNCTGPSPASRSPSSRPAMPAAGTPRRSRGSRSRA